MNSYHMFWNSANVNLQPGVARLAVTVCPRGIGLVSSAFGHFAAPNALSMVIAPWQPAELGGDEKLNWRDHISVNIGVGEYDGAH